MQRLEYYVAYVGVYEHQFSSPTFILFTPPKSLPLNIILLITIHEKYIGVIAHVIVHLVASSMGFVPFLY